MKGQLMRMVTQPRQYLLQPLRTAVNLSQRPTDLLLVVNPNAGRNTKKGQDRTAMVAFARRHGLVVQEEGLTAQAQAIADAFKKWPQGKPPLVACHGGDGTLHEVTKAMIKINGEKNLPALLPLSAGTMNVVWKNLGYRGELPKVLATAHQWLTEGVAAVHEKSLMRVQIDSQPDWLYGFIFANGAIFNLIREFDSDANHSTLGFFKILGGLLLRRTYRQQVFGKSDIETTLPNGEVLEGPMTGALLSTLDRLMFKIQLFDHDITSIDQIGLMVSRYGAGQMMLRWPGVLWRNLRPVFFIEPPQHFSDTVAGPVTFCGKGPFSLDGDLYSTTDTQRVRVEPGPLVCFPKI